MAPIFHHDRSLPLSASIEFQGSSKGEALYLNHALLALLATISTIAPTPLYHPSGNQNSLNNPPPTTIPAKQQLDPKQLTYHSTAITVIQKYPYPPNTTTDCTFYHKTRTLCPD